MATTVSDPMIGRLVDRRYEITDRIARGGMATVYRALDRRLDRVVALKVMHPHFGDATDVTARFRREARAAARLTHPGVVAVYDQGNTDDLQYLTMEYVPGSNLRSVLRRRGALTVGEALHVVEAILEALGAAHCADLVHRDMKPENILMTADGTVKVTDFGLARAVSEATLASSGSLLGTVAYLSPEIVTDGEADARADVYAVGAMLYELLTGHQPFSGDTPIQVAYQHVHSTVPPPSEDVLWLPYAVDELVATLTAHDPADRPPDASAARTLVQRVRSELDPHHLQRRADVAGSEGEDLPPAAVQEKSPAEAETHTGQDTTALKHTGTIALPIGMVTAETPDETSGAQRRKVRRRRTLAVVLSVLLLIALLGGGTWWYFTIGPGAYMPVPDVTGKAREAAVQTLAGQGLDSEADTAYSDSVPEGDVIDTSPAPGDQVRRDGTVQLTVSLGVQMLTVPEVAGAAQDEAVAQLRDAGFSISDPVEEAYSAEVDKGHVIGTDPEPGEEIRHDTPVTVTVSQGREPIDVPDVTGLSKDEAVAELDEIGAVPQIQNRIFDDEVAKGDVISQSATGDALRGDVVELTLSKGPELFEVPDVFGLQYPQAEEKLTGLGFQVERKDVLGGMFGTVRDQSVEAGEKVPRGTTITLTVV